ncbi:hypothetical protein VRK_08110 [Vibrio sp. MEBiC08052]|nr:hypothetical protein VRK_08110 [Vibrio sp. MEBiC08052]
MMANDIMWFTEEFRLLITGNAAKIGVAVGDMAVGGCS